MSHLNRLQTFSFVTLPACTAYIFTLVKISTGPSHIIPNITLYKQILTRQLGIEIIAGDEVKIYQSALKQTK